MPAFFQKAARTGYNNSGPRTLHFSNDKPSGKKGMIITDSDKITNLYIVSHRSSWSMFSSKPHMTITRVGGGGGGYINYQLGEIGTVKFHSISSSELTIHGRTVTLQKVNWVSRGRTLQSSAIAGSTLTWKFDSIWKDSMTCSNETGQWLARYSSKSKGGVLELAGPMVDGMLLDEIVVSALAILQEAKRTEAAAESTDAASSVVAAAAGV